MNITCAICDKPLNRYLCKECVKQMQKDGWIDTRRGER